MENPEIQTAWNIIANTDTHLFLTGKAGTGKTTFLRKLRMQLPKRMVVVAPTGIAAINAQGTTIHSFFQLGFGPQLPDAQHNIKKYQIRKQKINLIKSLDLIVIDEISMVRADVLDAIDRVLRQYRDRNKAFGGIQMLMIGDMQQLAPVAKEDEWRLLSPYYDTPYFFSSRALQSTDFVTIELKHVYRQTDSEFIDILNKVRNNSVDEFTLKKLNERYIPEFIPHKEDGYIRLTTHNRQAEEINRKELELLPTCEYHYEAEIKGEFSEMSFPTEKKLVLKIGAQVMFIKNDPSYEKEFYNGMIGEVIELTDETVVVRTYENNKEIKVGALLWENTKYELDEETKDIKEKIIGTFSQLPLKTAWAITVHKSQGLTFEHAIIDVQHSFAHGQTYVALSRCKTLKGLVLSSPIPPYAIINDKKVSDFTNDPRHQEPDSDKLEEMKKKYFLRITEELFSFSNIRILLNDTIRLMREYFYSSYEDTYNKWIVASEQLKQPESVATRFHIQYQDIIMKSQNLYSDELLQERIKKGATYFNNEVSFVNKLLNATNIKTNNKQIRERLNNLLQGLKDEYKLKASLLEFVSKNGIEIKSYLSYKAKASITTDIEDATHLRKQTYDDKNKWKKKLKQTMYNDDSELGSDDSKLPY